MNRTGDGKWKNKILTIPNALSLFRLILAVAFALVYCNADSRSDYYVALAVLFVSGVTDALDGKIARHFGMISDLGKVLDPFADKVTQAVVMCCMVLRFDAMRLMFLVLVIKELTQAGYGGYAIKKAGYNEGAMICGKVTTTYIYLMMGILLLIYDIPMTIANILIAIGICLLLWSFVSYMLRFRQLVREAAARDTEEADKNEGAPQG